jgi:hypothetical protein
MKLINKLAFFFYQFMNFQEFFFFFQILRTVNLRHFSIGNLEIFTGGKWQENVTYSTKFLIGLAIYELCFLLIGKNLVIYWIESFQRMQKKTTFQFAEKKQNKHWYLPRNQFNYVSFS